MRVSDFIVSELQVPFSSEHAREIGYDFDGDGVIDNKIGRLASYLYDLSDDQDPNQYFSDRVASGALALAVRVWSVGELGQASELAVQILPARVLDGTPLFDGSDVLVPLPEASTATHLCATRYANGLYCRNDRDAVMLPMPLAIGTAEPVFVASEHVRLFGPLEESGFSEMKLAGTARVEDLRASFFPRWQVGLNALIEAQPESESAQTALDVFDGNCEPTLPGCDPHPAGCASDGRIAEAELWCNALLLSASAPELSDQCFGDDSLIGFGVLISGVPATVFGAD